MLHAAAPPTTLVPCTCATQPRHLAEVSVAVHVVPADIEQVTPLPSKCCGLTQLSSESSCANGCRLPADQFDSVATVPNKNNPGEPVRYGELESVVVSVETPFLKQVSTVLVDPGAASSRNTSPVTPVVAPLVSVVFATPKIF